MTPLREQLSYDETIKNDLGYAIRHRGDIGTLGGAWVAADQFLESSLGFQIELLPDEAWWYCDCVYKSASGGSIDLQLLEHVAADVIDREYTEN